MEPDTRYSVIGAIVLTLVAVAVIGFVWLSSSGRDADFRFYTVYFEHQSLDGLQVGASVNMRGIAVGRVESYEIDPDNINRVKVLLRVERATPVRQNTRASVSRNFVTGIARIKLETPSPPGPELTQVPHGEHYPVVAEGQSGMDLITDSAARLAASADRVLGQANQLMGAENQRAFAELLANLRDLSQGVNARLTTFDKTAAELSQSQATFRETARRIAAAADRLTESAVPFWEEGGATLRQARSAIDDLSKATRTLEADLSRAVRTLEADGGALIRRGDTALDVGTLELRATAQELRSSAERIARALDRLQDPRAALLGPGERQLGPGEAR